MKLVLLRHGQSEWNLENKFTGWTDVDLTKKGEAEAKNAGQLIKNEKIKIFDRDLDNKIKSFNASMNINKPNDIDFLDKLDEPLNNDEMLDKLKQIEKERFIFSVNNDNKFHK